jgi:hypothetical protein
MYGDKYNSRAFHVHPGAMEARPELVEVYNGAVKVCLGAVEAHPGALEPEALESHSGAMDLAYSP